MADRDLLDRLSQNGIVELPSVTDEELASIHADRDMPVPLPALRQIPDDIRGAVLATALRSLVVRGLVMAPAGHDLTSTRAGGDLEVETRGNLDAILAIRRAPAALLLIAGASQVAILHGLREQDMTAYLEERLDDLGFHHFRLLTQQGAGEELARLADPERRTPTRATPVVQHDTEAVVGLVTSRQPQPGVTRIDAHHPDGRHAQTWIVVRPEGTFVVGWAAGDPEPTSVSPVDARGLHAALRAILARPGQESGR